MDTNSSSEVNTTTAEPEPIGKYYYCLSHAGLKTCVSLNIDLAYGNLTLIINSTMFTNNIFYVSRCRRV